MEGERSFKHNPVSNLFRCFHVITACIHHSVAARVMGVPTYIRIGGELDDGVTLTTYLLHAVIFSYPVLSDGLPV